MLPNMNPYEDEEVIIRSVKRRVILFRIAMVLLAIAVCVGLYFLYKLLSTVPEAPELNTSPVVLWSFEEDDLADWPGTDGADAAMRARGAEVIESGGFSTPFAALYRAGNITWSVKTNTFISSDETYGMSHGGSKALGIEVDVTNAVYGDTVYAHIWYTGGEQVLRDVQNQKIASDVGMWFHLPDSVTGLQKVTDFCMELTVYAGSSPDDLTAVQLPLYYGAKKLEQLTERDMPDDGWVFLMADISSYNYAVLAPEAYTLRDGVSLITMSFKTTYADTLVFCLDEVTLITNMTTFDRTPPVMEFPAYRTANSDTELEKSAVTVNASSLALEVSLQETTNSGSIWLDGTKLENVSTTVNLLTSKTMTLSRGMHHVRFTVTDANGNKAYVDRDFTVRDMTAPSGITPGGHSGTGEAPEAGSVYWFDLTAEYAEDIESITAVLCLNGANAWEVEYPEAAEGFEVACESAEGQPEIMTVTVTRTDSRLSGKQVLVSLPVRVWTYDTSAWTGGTAGEAPVRMTAEERFASAYGNPRVTVSVEVLRGTISYTYGKSGSFAGSYTAETRMAGKNTEAQWHTHTAESVQDSTPTCTQDGWRGRTYCSVCASVADRGTRLPAEGHEFAIQGGRIICTRSGCGIGFTGVWTDGQEYVNGTVPLDGWIGDKYYIHGVACTDVTEIDGVFYDFDDDGVSLGLYTGLLRIGGSYYYILSGSKYLDGWIEIDGSYYYFYTDSGKAAVGNLWLASWGIPSAVKYEFEITGRLLHGVWIDHEESRRYYEGPQYCRAEFQHGVDWETIDGIIYGFDNKGHTLCGIVFCKETEAGELFLQEFADSGEYIGPVTDTGIYPYNGKLFYSEDGVAVHAGLILLEGAFYYVQSNCAVVVDAEHTILESYTNGLLPAGTYAFGSDGKMLQGIMNGAFYINGQRANVGLIREDGYWYLTDENGVIARNTYVTIDESMAQDGIPAGRYWADDSGIILVE